MVVLIIRRKQINGVAIEPLLLAAVPAPSGIGIGIAAVTFRACSKSSKQDRYKSQLNHI